MERVEGRMREISRVDRMVSDSDIVKIFSSGKCGWSVRVLELARKIVDCKSKNGVCTSQSVVLVVQQKYRYLLL